MENLSIALNILKENHYKLTKQRRTLLEYLFQNSEYYVSLTDLDRQLRKTFPKMSYDTVYRNIREMQQIGIVETKKFDNGLRVKFQCDFISTVHSHFICQRCGITIELPLPDFKKIEVQQLPNFKVNTYHVEILGICDKCQAKENAKK